MIHAHRAVQNSHSSLSAVLSKFQLMSTWYMYMFLAQIIIIIISSMFLSICSSIREWLLLIQNLSNITQLTRHRIQTERFTVSYYLSGHSRSVSVSAYRSSRGALTTDNSAQFHPSWCCPFHCCPAYLHAVLFLVHCVLPCVPLWREVVSLQNSSLISVNKVKLSKHWYSSS